MKNVDVRFFLNLTILFHGNIAKVTLLESLQQIQSFDMGSKRVGLKLSEIWEKKGNSRSSNAHISAPRDLHQK